MKNGYDQFFKNARQAANQQEAQGVKFKRSNTPPLKYWICRWKILKNNCALVRALKVSRQKPKSSFPWKMVVFHS